MSSSCIIDVENEFDDIVDDIDLDIVGDSARRRIAIIVSLIHMEDIFLQCKYYMSTSYTRRRMKARLNTLKYQIYSSSENVSLSVVIYDHIVWAAMILMFVEFSELDCY